MASAVDSIAQYLAADLSLGTLANGVYEENLPDQPDTAVCVYGTGGRPPALTQSDDTDYPSFQILARSLDAATATANLMAAFHALHGLVETDVHGTHFKLIAFKQSNPVPLGRDEKQRFQFVMNAEAAVRGVNR